MQFSKVFLSLLIVLLSVVGSAQGDDDYNTNAIGNADPFESNLLVKRLRGEPIRFGKRSPREPIRFGKRFQPFDFSDE
ncbi:unnamed protein product [Caenorhabditis bovis]|uniref:Uncharacterized protein n=1 Tax=Caenorhabditis bovis TaxID=2654633 RepID=A0A8S1F8G5_9PELO|nr:unnamed protein product [Caenorhabditis bovis]